MVITMETNQDKYTESIMQMIDYCKQVLVEKHKEYAPGETRADHYHNFQHAARLMEVTPQQALAGMMVKHTVSIYDMIREAKSEPLEKWREKIGDNINYLLILWALVNDES